MRWQSKRGVSLVGLLAVSLGVVIIFMAVTQMFTTSQRLISKSQKKIEIKELLQFRLTQIQNKIKGGDGLTGFLRTQLGGADSFNPALAIDFNDPAVFASAFGTPKQEVLIDAASSFTFEYGVELKKYDAAFLAQNTLPTDKLKDLAFMKVTLKVISSTNPTIPINTYEEIILLP